MGVQGGPECGQRCGHPSEGSLRPSPRPQLPGWPGLWVKGPLQRLLGHRRADCTRTQSSCTKRPLGPSAHVAPRNPRCRKPGAHPHSGPHTGALHVRSRQNSHSCSLENVTLSCSHLKEVSQTLPKATRLDRVRTPSHQFCPPHPKHRGQVSGRQAGAESQLCRSLAETCLPS